MLDLTVTIGGIAYGAALVAVALARNRVTEALRIDALLLPRPNEQTRLLNPLIGLLLIGYHAYLLIGQGA